MIVVPVCVVVALVEMAAPQFWTLPELQVWATVFAAICLQATPFIVLGALLAAVVASLPAGWPRRWLPRRDLFAVPLLGVAGTALPGCECGTVATAATMMQHGVAVGPAISFMLSAPSANPVVLAATAAAFPGQPAIVAARFVAGLLTASVIGLLAARGGLGRPQLGVPEHRHAAADRRRWMIAVTSAANELARSLGLLTIGAAAAASATVLIPADVLGNVGRHEVVGVLALAALATVLCICSQADAFVARSFTGFSRTAQFAFMVVGAAVDLKILALQAGAFGVRFSIRFAGVVFVVALAVAGGVSLVLL